MSFAGLQWQTWTQRLVAGMNQKKDPRTLDPPELARAIDCQFDNDDGLTTRYPFTALGTSIVGGGSLSDVRRVISNGGELLVFTKTGLYSWSSTLSKWALRGTHLAVKVDEESRFITANEQTECDRAELSNTEIHVYKDGSIVYAQATDKTTGAAIATATYSGSSRPRVIALSTKILMFTWLPGSGLLVRAIDPADPATGFASAATTVIAAASFGDYYDVCRVASTDVVAGAARRATTTSYESFKVTSALAVTNSTKVRVCDGPIAVSCPTTGTHVQVIRTDINGAGPDVNVLGDLLLVGDLSDVYTAQAVGTCAVTVVQIAAAHRSVQNSSQYRCYVFWSDDSTNFPSATVGDVKYNWVDTGNTLGTQATFVQALGVGSRAFDYNGEVYVNLVFTGQSSSDGTVVQLQNTFFLYRDDAFLCAKSAYTRAGGFHTTTGHLPGVALTSGTTTFSWCGTDRRQALLAAGSGYTDRGPRDITLTFDSDDARRCARLGATLYIACGEGVLQYDGVSLTELGFHFYPYYFGIQTYLGSGNVEPGVYSHKATYRSDNAVGERDRSTTATVTQATLTGVASSSSAIQLNDPSPLTVTHKTNVAVEFWRTLKNPTDDAPFYLATGVDPSVTTGDNCFVFNDPTAGVLTDWQDELADDDLASKATNPENGAVLETIAPPAASIIIASDTRLFLAGVAGDPNRIWYSKQRLDGEVAAFHDALTADIPLGDGGITGLAWHFETPIVFRERSMYVLLNDGFDNVGGGQNFVAREISPEVGAVNHESIATTDKGTVFKSEKGWYLLNRGLQLEYIGAAFADYDSETVLAVQVVKTQHQVRILTASRMMVFDYLLTDRPWRAAEWSVDDGVHACLWNGAHVYATTTSVKQQGTTYTGVDYGMVIELAWLKFADLQGFVSVRLVQVLGEYRSAHRIKIELARDYWKDGEDTYFQTKTWSVSPTTTGAREKVSHSPKIQQLEALKLKLSVLGPNSDAVPSGEAVKLSALSFEFGFQPGLNRHIPAAQTQ